MLIRKLTTTLTLTLFLAGTAISAPPPFGQPMQSGGTSVPPPPGTTGAQQTAPPTQTGETTPPTQTQSSAQQVRSDALARCEKALQALDPNFKPFVPTTQAVPTTQSVPSNQGQPQGNGPQAGQAPKPSEIATSVIDLLVNLGILNQAQAVPFRLIPTGLRIVGQSGSIEGNELASKSPDELKAILAQHQALNAALLKYEDTRARLEVEKALHSKAADYELGILQQEMQDAAKNAADAVQNAQNQQAANSLDEQRKRLQEVRDAIEAIQNP